MSKLKKSIPFFLAAGGVIMMIMGITRGEQQEVWIKAINICLECVGIG